MIEAVSSGFCIGSINWILHTSYEKLGYVAQSNLVASEYCMASEVEPFKNCDAIFFSQLRDGTKPYEQTINEMQGAISI